MKIFGFLSENFHFLVVKFSVVFEQACFRNENEVESTIGERVRTIGIDMTLAGHILFDDRAGYQ